MENKILMTLSTDATILDNDASITLVSSSFMQLKESMEKSALTNATEGQIDKNRVIYQPFAAYATIIYFTLGILFILANASPHKICYHFIGMSFALYTIFRGA